MASAAPAAGGGGGVTLYSIAVEPSKTTEAMALLNQSGLPRHMGTDLLTLFAKQGFMTSEREDTIRYQAGLAQQIANMIRKIDGVIDADVQLSFPPPATGIPGAPTTVAPTRVTAAVYVKHQGVLDDPNSHLVTKIKRLVAGSVNALDINDVTVIPDRSRYSDITLSEMKETISSNPKEYVSIWSIVMSKHSAMKFRIIFFTFSFLVILFAAIAGWLIWKFFPLLRQRGWKELLRPAPIPVVEYPPEAPAAEGEE